MFINSRDKPAEPGCSLQSIEGHISRVDHTVEKNHQNWRHDELKSSVIRLGPVSELDGILRSTRGAPDRGSDAKAICQPPQDDCQQTPDKERDREGFSPGSYEE